jgi:hypothetical protein
VSNIPDNPDVLLHRDHLAVALTAAGFPVTASTLATKATRGGGPPFTRFLSRPQYRWGDALQWAQGQRKQPVRATSVLEAA